MVVVMFGSNGKTAFLLAFVSQDSAIKRPENETIVADGDMVTGINTKFTQLFKDRDKLRFRGKSEQFKVGGARSNRQKATRMVCSLVD